VRLPILFFGGRNHSTSAQPLAIIGLNLTNDLARSVIPIAYSLVNNTLARSALSRCFNQGVSLREKNSRSFIRFGNTLSSWHPQSPRTLNQMKFR